MEKEKRRKLHLVLYGCAIPVSLFGLYTFAFDRDGSPGRKTLRTVIALGWLISAVLGFAENLKK